MSGTQRPTFGVTAKKTFQKIAIEETISTHVFNATATLPSVDSTVELFYVDSNYVTDVKNRLINVETRVKIMKEVDVDFIVISLIMSEIEEIFNTAIAIEIARKVNDEIHESISTRITMRLAHDSII